MKKKSTPRPPRKAVDPGPHFRWGVRHKVSGTLVAGFLYQDIADAYIRRGANAGGWSPNDLELIDLTKQETTP